MKHLVCPSLPACVLALLCVLTSISPAAEAAASPDYKALINGLFDRAATCEVVGTQQVIKRHSFDFTTPDASSLQKLREIFLRGKP